MSIQLQDDEIVRFVSVINKLVDENNKKVIGFKYQQSITMTKKEQEFLMDLQAKIKIE